MVHDVWFALRFFLFLSSASFGLELNAKELALSRSRHVGNRHSGSTFLASRYDADHGLKAPPWAICKGIMQDTYSASWLTNADFIRKLAYEPERLYKRGTNMEGASFLLFQVKGSVKIKTMDMLDLFVEHLSWYERRLRLGMSRSQWLKDQIHRQFIARIEGHNANLMRRREHYDPGTRPMQDVVAVMPFFAANEGVGHSDVDLRRRYLLATFWPLRDIFPHIVISVCEQSDLEYVRSAGLPVYDVFYTPVPDPRKLGVATLFRTNRALNGELAAAGSTMHKESGWHKFNFVYYTESDQILRVRNLNYWLSLAARNDHIVVPHRAAPVPRFNDFQGGPTQLQDNSSVFWQLEAPLTRDELQGNGLNELKIISDPQRDRCCFPTEDHACRNKHHLQSNASELTLIQFSSSTTDPEKMASSFAIVAGEGNFWKMRFRRCNVHNAMSASSASTSTENVCHDASTNRKAAYRPPRD